MTALTYNISLALGLALTAAGAWLLAGLGVALLCTGATLCALTVATAHLVRRG